MRLESGGSDERMLLRVERSRRMWAKDVIGNDVNGNYRQPLRNLALCGSYDCDTLMRGLLRDNLTLIEILAIAEDVYNDDQYATMTVGGNSSGVCWPV